MTVCPVERSFAGLLPEIYELLISFYGFNRYICDVAFVQHYILKAFLALSLFDESGQFIVD